MICFSWGSGWEQRDENHGDNFSDTLNFFYIIAGLFEGIKAMVTANIVSNFLDASVVILR